MRVLGREIIGRFVDRHADAKNQTNAWILEALEAEWKTPSDIKARYASASFLSGNRVVFNIKGRRYRLEVQISYKNKIVLVLRVGTHAEYSKWD